MRALKLFLSIIVLTMCIGEYCQAQDWPNLGRFRDENAKIGLPAPGEDRVIFMGNSITQGWSDFSPEFFKDRPYLNRGISGQTTPQMLVRFRADVIALKPAVVVILAGTNDIAGNTGPSTLEMIVDNIASMAELAKSHGIKVIICSVLPAFDYPWSPGLNPNEKIPALNSMLRKYAGENDFIYLDYFAAMADERNGMKAELTYDGVHPNLAGYKVMEPLVENAISQALKSGKMSKCNRCNHTSSKETPAVVTPDTVSLTGTHWSLTAINEAKVENPAANLQEAYIVLMTDNKSLTGSGGCNSLFGTYHLKGNNGIEIEQVGSTKMFCDNMDSELKILSALREVNSYSIKGDTLILKKGGKIKVLSFRAMSSQTVEK
jgi:heat shock protein HslJ/lysophospholipase L1-like esterase